MLLKPKKNLVTVLDIGSTKIAALLARIYEGNVSIIGFACKPSQGIKNGIIIDIRKAANAISTTIEELENICGEAIESAYITITSCGLSSHNLNFEILTGSGEIGEREIKTVLDKGHESLKENDKLAALHCLPIEYMLDGTSGIVNPYGMYGNCLAVKLHIIAASKPLLINIASCLGRCHLSTSGYIATAYADGFACISDDDKNLGTILVDIGGGTTSLGIYKDNNFIHIDSIPIGGINITKDIACAFSLSINVAEKLKITHGNLYPSSDYHEMIEYDDMLVKEDDQVRIEELAPISKFDLNDVINARVDEIIDMVNERLMKVKNNVQLFRKIILTGGTSKIDGMREKFIKKFNTTVSYGKQDKLRYSDYDITDPSLSAAVGSVLLINDFFHDNATERQPLSAKTTGQKSTLVKWIQKHF